MPKIVGQSGQTAEVSADNALYVQPLLDSTKAGHVAIAAESAPATDPSGSRLIRPLEVNADYRLRVVQETPIYQRYFGVGAQTADVQTAVSTHAVAYNTPLNGGMTLNSGASTAAGNSQVQTYRSFQLPPSGIYYFEATLRWSAPATNSTWEFGLRAVAVATTTITDGACLRMTTAGVLQLVLAQNNTEQTQDISQSTIASTERHHVILAINQKFVECWIDNKLCATLSVNGSQVAKGFNQFNAWQMYALHRNTGVASPAVSLNIFEWAVWDAVSAINKPIQHAMAGSGYHSPFNPATQAQVTTWANSADIVTGSLSNTTPSLSTLGGRVAFAATAGANTDYALFGYQNDTGIAAAGHGKTLYVTGITIDGATTGGAANSGTVPTTLAFGVAVGSTGASLATTDAVATRTPKRLPVGMMMIPVSAVIGQAADRNINVQFNTPLMVETGCYFHVIMRIVSGAATATQFITIQCGVHGYWE